jgi:flavin-binding protein dodecin
VGLFVPTTIAGLLKKAFRGKNSSPTKPEEESSMLKVIEILAESDKSWEDAAVKAVATAAKTVRKIKSINVKNFQATVENDRIVKYRVNAKISFVPE